MKKVVKLDEELTLYFTTNFPSTCSSYEKSFRYEATIGVGGNVGDVIRRFNRLLHVMRRSSFLEPIETSPILQNPPFGFLEQDDFFNAIVKVKTSLRPRALMRYLQRLEKRFKRKKTFENAPRELDLDIVFFNKEKIEYRDLTIPHKSYRERRSVLIPLQYMRRLSER
ncbi:MAG: 2-amino-4-hydroxy-6-hydroxymethyldihydropteridine diphosphokinase [Campylobacterota bacterium]|nr:2-amino-4-hydroxy-6-hydroxymethyldihydropteridine diphosphokinase [Campylobacterota bacterium]